MPKGNHMGSRSKFLYEGDDGVVYVVELDVSKALSMGFAPAISAANPVNPDKFLQMRYVNLTHPVNSNVKRRWEVPTQSRMTDLLNGTETVVGQDPLSNTPGDDINWIINSYRGEAGRLPSFGESGLDDSELP